MSRDASRWLINQPPSLRRRRAIGARSASTAPRTQLPCSSSSLSPLSNT